MLLAFEVDQEPGTSHRQGSPLVSCPLAIGNPRSLDRGGPCRQGDCDSLIPRRLVPLRIKKNGDHRDTGKSIHWSPGDQGTLVYWRRGTLASIGTGGLDPESPRLLEPPGTNIVQAAWFHWSSSFLQCQGTKAPWSPGDAGHCDDGKPRVPWSDGPWALRDAWTQGVLVFKGALVPRSIDRQGGWPALGPRSARRQGPAIVLDREPALGVSRPSGQGRGGVAREGSRSVAWGGPRRRSTGTIATGTD